MPASAGAAPACHSITAAWFERATVRAMAPIVLDAQYDWRYPVELKPLLGHPLVAALPQAQYRQLCVQSLYKYMHDICLTETDIVNRVSLAIAYNRSSLPFPAQMCADAFSIIVDESFHSYVARLFALEVARVTGLEPVPMPGHNQLGLAITQTRSAADPQAADLIDLLCCCVSESTFTKEVLEASKLTGYDPGFHQLMREHLKDEGRHYSYFRTVLAYFWEHAAPAQRTLASRLMPTILLTYFDDAIERDFDRALLAASGMAEPDIARVIEDSYGRKPPLAQLPRLKNALAFLAQAGLMDDPLLRHQLAQHGLLAGH